MCSGVHTKYSTSMRDLNGRKIAIFRNKIIKCICEIFNSGHIRNNSEHHMCTVCVYSKMLLVQIFSLLSFFCFLFAIKFNKVTFYGQNTWFSLLKWPRKNATEATTEHITDCQKSTKGTKILLRFSHLISFSQLWIQFFCSKTWAEIEVNAFLFLFLFACSVSFCRIVLCSIETWILHHVTPNGQSTSTHNQISNMQQAHMAPSISCSSKMSSDTFVW